MSYWVATSNGTSVVIHVWPIKKNQLMNEEM